MEEKEINIKIENQIIKLDREGLIKLLPNESINLLPKEDTSTLMVKLPINKLEEIGFSFNDYELLFEINNKNGVLYMNIYNPINDICHLLNKLGYNGYLVQSRK